MKPSPAIACLLFLTGFAATAEPAPDIDYFVLALSWSPTYCSENPGRNGDQCGAETPYGFIVHGLWPQFEDGPRSYCQSDEPEWVPRSLAESMRDLMPGVGLVGYQWRKHGTCAGLDQHSYFALIRSAAERVTIPMEFRDTRTRRTVAAMALEDAFGRTNLTLDADEMAVICRRQRLQEIRICLDRDLQFLACPDIDRRGCRSRRILVPEDR